MVAQPPGSHPLWLQEFEVELAEEELAAEMQARLGSRSFLPQKSAGPTDSWGASI